MVEKIFLPKTIRKDEKIVETFGTEKRIRHKKGEGTWKKGTKSDYGKRQSVCENCGKTFWYNGFSHHIRRFCFDCVPIRDKHPKKFCLYCGKQLPFNHHIKWCDALCATLYRGGDCGHTKEEWIMKTSQSALCFGNSKRKEGK